MTDEKTEVKEVKEVSKSDPFAKVIDHVSGTVNQTIDERTSSLATKDEVGELKSSYDKLSERLMSMNTTQPQAKEPPTLDMESIKNFDSSGYRRGLIDGLKLERKYPNRLKV